MIGKIKSLILFFEIQFLRFVDHSWRFLTGLPQVQRSMITPELYLGGQYSLRSVWKLKRLGVNAIVNLRESPINQKHSSNGLNILNLPTPDKAAPTLKQLQEGSEFIDSVIKKGGKVYIHCWWGEERGPTMAVAYLIWTGLLFEDALKLVKNTRKFIRPTKAQIERLKEFEKLLEENKS